MRKNEFNDKDSIGFFYLRVKIINATLTLSILS